MSLQYCPTALSVNVRFQNLMMNTKETYTGHDTAGQAIPVPCLVSRDVNGHGRLNGRLFGCRRY